MRKLFIPLAKLLGIYLFYRSLISLASLLYYLFSNFFSEQDTIRSNIIYTIIIQILSLLIAVILLFKTKRIADIIHLPDDDINLAGTDHYSILHTGLILIGVVIVIYGITIFLGSVVAFFYYRDTEAPRLFYQILQRMVTSILKAILGIILVFKSVQIAKYFDEQTERMKWR